MAARQRGSCAKEKGAACSPRMTSSSVGDSPRVLRTPCVNHLSPSPPECRHTKFEYVFLLCAAPARQTGPVQLLRQRLQQHGVHCWGRGRQCQCAWHAHRCRDSRGAWTVPQPPTGPQHPSTTSNTVAEHEEWVLQHATELECVRSLLQRTHRVLFFVGSCVSQAAAGLVLRVPLLPSPTLSPPCIKPCMMIMLVVLCFAPRGCWRFPLWETGLGGGGHEFCMACTFAACILSESAHTPYPLRSRAPYPLRSRPMSP